jgi:hypothetical protein
VPRDPPARSPQLRFVTKTCQACIDQDPLQACRCYSFPIRIK